MHINSLCSQCKSEQESINHVLFKCPFAITIWRLSNSPALQNSHFSDDVEDNVQCVLNLSQHSGISDLHKLLPMWLLWRIWKARNNFVFNKIRESPSKIVLKAKAETNNWLHIKSTRNNKASQASNRPAKDNKWWPPEKHLVKCNFDTSFQIQNLQATGGWIIRDQMGTPTHWGSSNLNHAATPLEAETKALLVAVQQVWIRGYKSVCFEGDCEVLIKVIKGESKNQAIDNLVTDIRLWASNFDSVCFCFTRRDCNRAAHCLAAYNCPSGFYSDSVNMPSWLKKHMCTDFSS